MDWELPVSSNFSPMRRGGIVVFYDHDGEGEEVAHVD